MRLCSDTPHTGLAGDLREREREIERDRERETERHTHTQIEAHIWFVGDSVTGLAVVWSGVYCGARYTSLFVYLFMHLYCVVECTFNTQIIHINRCSVTFI